MRSVRNPGAGAARDSDATSATGRKLRELRALAAVGQAVAKCGDAEETYERIARTVGAVMPFDRFSVASRNDVGWFTDVFVLDRRIPRWRKGETYRLRGPVASEVIEDGRFDQLIDQIVGKGTQQSRISFPDRFPSLLRVPVDFRGRNIGLLALRSERPRAYNRRHLAFAVQVAAKLAPTIGYLQILSDAASRNEQVVAARHSRLTFVQNVSERLQNPLTAARTAAGLVAEGLRDEVSISKVSKAADLLIRSLDRLVRVVDRAAEYASIEARDRQMTFELFDLGEVVRRLLADRSDERIKRGLSAECPQGTNALEGYGDPRLIERCLEELIDNAHRYASPGSTIRVSWYLEDLSLVIEISNSSGPLDAERMLTSSLPLYAGPVSAPSGQASSGMGLSIADVIARAHGGRLSVASSEGRIRVETRIPSLAAFRVMSLRNQQTKSVTREAEKKLEFRSASVLPGRQSR